jgi:hypothetical protein
MLQRLKTDLGEIPSYLVSPYLSSAWVAFEGLHNLHAHANADPFSELIPPPINHLLINGNVLRLILGDVSLRIYVDAISTKSHPLHDREVGK